MYLPIQRLATYQNFWNPAIFVLQILVVWKTPAGTACPVPQKGDVVGELRRLLGRLGCLTTALRLQMHCMHCMELPRVVAWHREWMAGWDGVFWGRNLWGKWVEKQDCFITYVWPKIRRCLGPGKAGWRIHAVAELWLVGMVWQKIRFSCFFIPCTVKIAQWRLKLIRDAAFAFECLGLVTFGCSHGFEGFPMWFMAGVGLKWWKIKGSPHKSYRQFGGWTWRGFACLLIYLLEFRLL